MNAVELVVTGEPALDAVRAALRGWYAVAVAGGAADRERIYYDTFDGRLRAAGLCSWWEAGALLVAGRDDHAPPLHEPLAGEPPPPLHVEALTPGPVRLALEPVIRPRVLLEVARIRVETVPVSVLDALDKTVVRMLLESPEGLPARVRLTPMRGYGRELRQVRELLGAASNLSVAREPLVDAAVRAGGGNPAGVRPGVSVELDRDEPADGAVARVLAALLEVIDRNVSGVLDDIDTEFLHDYRVALRRTRAVVRELPPVFPPARREWAQTELRWLQLATAQTRDLDVYLRDFEQLRALATVSLRADLEPLRDVLRERHLDARLRMVRDLRGERVRRLRVEWGELLEGLPALPVDDRPDARTPIGELTRTRIRRLHRRMIRMGRGIDPSSPPADYHELRKHGKELRYMLELFGRPLRDPAVVTPMLRTLKGLQDVLGRHQDREVQIEVLRSLAGDVGRRPDGASALLAMGVLIEHLEADAARARAEFAERFAEFSSRRQRRLIEDTFSS